MWLVLFYILSTTIEAVPVDVNQLEDYGQLK
jgi:hypothetical protein